ncbi:MAG: putative Na+/H+ antiporter, partial [Limisphaerales bacterium]
GLTVIANAPNPAGVSLLGRFFGGSVSPFGLLLGAVIPTVIAALCFLLL